MLNGERVVLMTRLAAFEQRKGKKSIQISRYFRSDYLLIQILKTLLYATISFLILFGLYVLYNLETLTESLYEMDLFAFAQKVIMLYGVFVAVNCVIAYVVYSYRYLKARKNLKQYMHNLKKLESQQ